MAQLILQEPLIESDLKYYPFYCNWISTFASEREIDLFQLLDKPFVYCFLSRTDLFNTESLNPDALINFEKKIIEHIDNLFYNPNQEIDKELVLKYFESVLNHKENILDESNNLILLSKSNNDFSSDIVVNKIKLSTYHTIENNFILNKDGIVRESIKVIKDDKVSEIIYIEGKSQIEIDENVIYIKRINYDKKLIDLIKANRELVQIGVNKDCKIIFNII